MFELFKMFFVLFVGLNFGNKNIELIFVVMLEFYWLGYVVLEFVIVGIVW